MTRIINAENAPASIGPYVQAVDLGNMILTSGQIPVCSKSGQVAEAVTESGAPVAGECQSYRRGGGFTGRVHRKNNGVCRKS